MEITAGMGGELYRAAGVDRKTALRKKNGKPEEKKADAAAKPVSADASNRLDSIRDRMNQGYYNRKDVDEVISDKLSGAFDQLA